MLVNWFFPSLALFATTFAFAPPQNWKNIKQTRAIDLSRSYVKEHQQFTITNVADTPVDEYFFAVPDYVLEKLSSYHFIAATNSKFLDAEDLATEVIDGVTSVNGQSAIKYIKVKLPHPVAPASEFRFTVDMTVLDMVVPMPAKIELADTQTLLLRTVKKPLSAYETIKASLSITGVDGAQELALEGEDLQDAGAIADDSLQYQFGDVSPFTMTSLALAYTHNLPLVKVTELVRDVWVSHWSNSLQFEEFYKMTNRAAELKSGFSRSQHMKNKMGLKASHALLALEVPLTSGASDIYYTDLVGNVSTSRVFPGKVYVRPRYPVFGGWNYNFTLGWNEKLTSFVKSVGSDEYILSVPLLNGPNDASYDEVSLSFFLPEGSEFIEAESPVAYTSLTQDYEYSYLDMNKGHTKVTLKFSNLVDDLRNEHVLIKYRFTTLNLIQKPLDIAKYAFVALVSYFLLTKIDISLKARK